jgi:hypothetical protein
MKKLALLGAMVFALSGCGTTGSGDAAMGGSSEVDAAIAAAEAAIKKAKAADGEWRDSAGKYLKAAKAAAAKGDTETALKKAKYAQFEGEMGEKQAMEQKNAGPWLF